MNKLNADVYKSRRQQLAKKVDGGLLMLSAYDLMQQVADMPHPFRQEANFLYLTGIDEPGWQMIYDGMRNRCWIVRPELTETEIVFEGEIPDKQILDISGADEIILEADLDVVLRQIRRQHAAIYTYQPSVDAYRFKLNPAQQRLTKRLARIFANIQNIERELSDMRAIKTTAELALIRRAIAITQTAFKAVQDNIQDYKHEYEVEAEFWRQFRSQNAVQAYSPIVACGNNATILHYEKNDDKIVRRKMLLLDCGASYAGYNADITRTIAVGEPSQYQKNIYNALLDAQEAIIRLIKPGLSFREYQQSADEIMRDMLRSVGLLKSTDDESAYRKYLPHAISHGLGIDVHESLGSSGYFQPGMVLTVEPGIYIKEKQLGIRIEDDILVTESGRQNLSKIVSTVI